MKTKSKRIRVRNEPHKASILPSWEFVVLTVFFWTGALFTGFYFESAYLPMTAVAFVILGILFLFAKHVQWSILHAFVILFVLSYWVSSINAIDVNAAILGAAKVSSLIPLIFILSRLKSHHQILIKKQWVGLAVFLTIIGWTLALYRDGRLETTLEYSNTFALLILLALWYAWDIVRDGRNLYYGIAIPILVIGLFQTGSRAVIMLFALGCCVAIFYYINKIIKNQYSVRIVCGSIIIAIAGIALILNRVVTSVAAKRLIDWDWRDDSFVARRELWTNGINLIREKWLLGYGSGGWADYNPMEQYFKYVHHHFIQVALDAGILGLICFILMIIIPVVRRWNFIGMFSIYPLTVFVFHSSFDFNLEYPLIFGIFLFIIYNLYSMGGEIPHRDGPRFCREGLVYSVSWLQYS
jgi:O-antigen ligase